MEAAADNRSQSLTLLRGMHSRSMPLFFALADWFYAEHGHRVALVFRMVVERHFQLLLFRVPAAFEFPRAN